MNKKLLSLLLALVMVFSFIPAFAAEEAPAETDKKVEETEKAVEEAEEVAAPEEAETTPEFVKFLTDNGYVQGDKKGDLMLDKNLTRAQFTALLARLDGKDDVAKAMKTLGTKFMDVTEAHWAIGYINFAAGKAWVNGYPDGTFGPEREVTYAEIATVLVRYLGVDTMGFSYPVDYVAKAYELGLMKGLPEIENHKQAATRKDMFQMLYNTISQKDFGRFNVYKMIVLENNRTTNLRPNEVKAEVLSIVQQANNVDERGVAKVGEQKKFSLVRKNAKDEDEVIADSENLLGKVINATVNEKGELVKVEIDNSYDYLFGSLTKATDKQLGVNWSNYDVRVDERYYHRDDRRYDNDDRMYRTYLTKGSKAENFSYREFADKVKAEKIEPNYVRATVKDGMVMFIDAFQWNDVAPVKEVKRDGKDVYYYDDASDAAVRRIQPKGRIIGYTEKDGFYALTADKIKADDVMHWTNNLYIVRQDAPVSGKLVKHFVEYYKDIDASSEMVTIDEDDYYLNSGANEGSPYRSVYGYKDHYKTTMSRFNLNDMLDGDVTALLDIAGDIQLIRSGRMFNDRLALLSNAAYDKFSFYAPNKLDDYTAFWDTKTFVQYFPANGTDQTLSTSAKTADKFERLDLVYTLTGSEKAADVIALYATRDYMSKHMSLVSNPEISRWNSFIKIGDKQMRYDNDTEVFAVQDISKSNSPVIKITMAEAIAHIRNGYGDLNAYVVSQADYARFLKHPDRGFAGFNRYNDFAEDLAKTIVFSGWQGLGYDWDYKTYARVDANMTFDNYTVRLDLGNGNVETFKLSKEFNTVKAHQLRAGQEIFIAVLNGEKDAQKEIVIEQVLRTPNDFVAYGRYGKAMNAYGFNTTFKAGEKQFYTDSKTQVFGQFSQYTPYVKVVGIDGTTYKPGYARAIYFVEGRDAKTAQIVPTNVKAADKHDKQVPTDSFDVLVKDAKYGFVGKGNVAYVPAGLHDVKIAKPGYVTSRALKVNVTAEDVAKQNDVALPESVELEKAMPSVKYEKDEKSIDAAKVTVEGTDFTGKTIVATTDLSTLAAGEYTATYVDNNETNKVNFTITPEQATKLHEDRKAFVVDFDKDPTYALKVVVKHGDKLVEGAEVEINGVKKMTSANGEAVFEGLENKEYTVNVFKSLYKAQSVKHTVAKVNPTDTLEVKLLAIRYNVTYKIVSPHDNNYKPVVKENKLIGEKLDTVENKDFGPTPLEDKFEIIWYAKYDNNGANTPLTLGTDTIEKILEAQGFDYANNRTDKPVEVTIYGVIKEK